MTAIDRWRPKARDRYSDARLASARYQSGCIETLLYHERLCDLIDDARTNEVRTTLATIAADVLDTPRFESEDWVRSRVGILVALRDVGLIEIDGEVTPFGQLVVRLPERTYERWHVTPRQKQAAAQPRGERGRFAKETPAPTADHRNGAATVPVPVPSRMANGAVGDRTETETGTERVGGGGSAREPGQPVSIDAIDAEDTKAFVDRVGAKLAEVIDGDTMFTAQQLQWRAKGPHPKTRERYPLSQWEAAVDLLVQRIRQGNVPDGDPIGYLIGIVPGAAAAPVSVKADAIGTDRPARKPATNLTDKDGSKWDAVLAAAETKEAAS